MVSGLVLIPDPFVDVPPGFLRVLLFAMFSIAAVFSGWTVFNTRRAMIWMASLGPEWWPGRATGIRLANKPGWVWFYRVDCGVVFAGSILTLITHFVKELTH
jgi:hypothetical protein